MKKIKLLAICLCLILPLSISILVRARITDNTDLLAPYKLELERINIELGTAYSFASEEELLTQTNYTMDSLIDFYTSMSIDEYREYIYDAHQNISIFLEKNINIDSYQNNIQNLDTNNPNVIILKATKWTDANEYLKDYR